MRGLVLPRTSLSTSGPLFRHVGDNGRQASTHAETAPAERGPTLLLPTSGYHTNSSRILRLLSPIELAISHRAKDKPPALLRPTLRRMWPSEASQGESNRMSGERRGPVVPNRLCPRASSRV